MHSLICYTVWLYCKTYSCIYYTVHVIVLPGVQLGVLYYMWLYCQAYSLMCCTTCDCIARHTAWCAVLHVIVSPGVQLDVLYYTIVSPGVQLDVLFYMWLYCQAYSLVCYAICACIVCTALYDASLDMFKHLAKQAILFVYSIYTVSVCVLPGTQFDVPCCKYSRRQATQHISIQHCIHVWPGIQLDEATCSMDPWLSEPHGAAIPVGSYLASPRHLLDVWLHLSHGLSDCCAADLRQS